jgi:hypothetical protein
MKDQLLGMKRMKMRMMRRMMIWTMTMKRRSLSMLRRRLKSENSD